MRKRSKYRPKGVRPDPLRYVMDGVTPFRDCEAGLTLRIRNHDALNNVRLGEGTREDVDSLIGTANMTEALARMKFGQDWADEILAGLDALLAVARRGKDNGRFVMSGPELTALNLLMEIHDAQLDACTVRDIELAINIVNKEMKLKRARKI